MYQSVGGSSFSGYNNVGATVDQRMDEFDAAILNDLVADDIIDDGTTTGATGSTSLNPTSSGHGSGNRAPICMDELSTSINSIPIGAEPNEVIGNSPSEDTNNLQQHVGMSEVTTCHDDRGRSSSPDPARMSNKLVVANNRSTEQDDDTPSRSSSFVSNSTCDGRADNTRDADNSLRHAEGVLRLIDRRARRNQDVAGDTSEDSVGRVRDDQTLERISDALNSVAIQDNAPSGVMTPPSQKPFSFPTTQSNHRPM